MDFIPFNDSVNNGQTPQTVNKRKSQSKLSFGSPAGMPAFGSPAVGFSPVVNSSVCHKTPSPRHFSQTFTPKSPRHPYNQSPRHPYQYQNFIDHNSVSPRNQHNARNNFQQKNGYSPGSVTNDCGNTDGHKFRAPQFSPNSRGRGMGRKSMTWTYGQVNYSLKQPSI